MNILIAGCGDVGNALGQRLALAGARVWGIRRNADKVAESITPIAIDMTAPIMARQLPPEIDCVFFLPTPDARTAAGYRRIFVDALYHLLNALQNGHLPRLIYVSSTSVWGLDDASEVDEETPAGPASQTAEELLCGEDLALNSGFEATVVRFAGIYGPGRNRLIERVRERSHKVSTVKYTNRIHRHDCARLLQHVAALPNIQPRYIGVDSRPALESEVMDYIAELLNQPPLERALEADSRGKRCLNRRILESGFSFDYPDYEAGYRELVRTYSGRRG